MSAEKIQAAEKEVQLLKLQLIDENDPNQSAALMRQIVAKQREIVALKNGDAIPEQEETSEIDAMLRRENARTASQEIRRLKSECDPIVQQIARMKKGEDDSELKAQLDQKQQEIARYRGVLKEVETHDTGIAMKWWEAMSPSARLEVLSEWMQKADKEDDDVPKDTWAVGFCRAQLDFLRSGTPIPAKNVLMIWRRRA